MPPATAIAQAQPGDDVGGEGVYNWLGQLLLDLKRLDEAIAASKRAIEIKPTACAHFVQARVLQERKQFREAIKQFDIALQLEFGSESLYQRAMCKSAAGDAVDALKDLKELETRNPGYSNTRDWIKALQTR